MRFKSSDTDFNNNFASKQIARIKANQLVRHALDHSK